MIARTPHLSINVRQIDKQSFSPRSLPPRGPDAAKTRHHFPFFNRLSEIPSANPVQTRGMIRSASGAGPGRTVDFSLSPLSQDHKKNACKMWGGPREARQWVRPAKMRRSGGPPREPGRQTERACRVRKSCTTSSRCSGESCSRAQRSIRRSTAALSLENGATTAAVDHPSWQRRFTRIP